MAHLQEQVSGPMDVTAATEVLDGLQGLFPLAEQAAAHAQNVARKSPQPDDGAADLNLDPEHAVVANVLDTFAAGTDVKPETMERFAANRWRKAFRQLRSMTDGALGGERTAELDALDERAVMVAKRFIRRWMEDPGLIAVLRVALDLVPDEAHLELVVTLLDGHLEKATPSRAKAACHYLAAEVLRAGATETGFTRHSSYLPRQAQIEKYRERLARFAILCAGPSRQVPWFLRQQAMLFLAVHGEALKESQLLDAGDDLLRPYADLHRFLGDLRNDKRKPLPDPAVIIVAHHLRGSSSTFAALIAQRLSSLPVPAAVNLVHALFEYDDELGKQIIAAGGSSPEQPTWRREVLMHLPAASPASVPLAKGRYLLADVIASTDNPLVQENAVVFLAMELVRLCIKKPNVLVGTSPNQLHAVCRDWERLEDPRARHEPGFLKLSIVRGAYGRDNSYAPEKWWPKKLRWRYSLGRLVRAAVTGQLDFSLSRRAVAPVVGAYRGLRHGHFGRQFAMAHTPEALGGPGASVSPWLGELLLLLLRWPGVQDTTRLLPHDAVLDQPAGLLKVLEERLAHQEGIFGAASGTPVYELPAFTRARDSDTVTLVMAQTVFPRGSNLEAHPRLNDPAHRVLHRRHLASVLRLVQATLMTRKTFGKRHGADLIVLPELSVHREDVDLLERLVDKTGAMILCGMTFFDEPSVGALVNQALWLVPDYRPEGRRILRRWQGKFHMTATERRLGVQSHRPHQLVVKGRTADGQSVWRITGAICYDATDLQLAADLRDQTDAFVVAALNKDIPTFDHMVEALHYHMYQHFVLVNSGEFGGSTVQAPYSRHHEKLVVHCHGNEQAAISVCEINLTHCVDEVLARKLGAEGSDMKHPPAGLRRRREARS